MSGMIQIMVFDKTGTLTEDGLQILGVRGINGTASDAPIFKPFAAKVTDIIPDFKHTSLSVLSKLKSWLLTEAMASC